MKRIFKLSILCAGIALIGSMSSCEKDYLQPIEAPDIDSTIEVSFSATIIPIFNDNCNSVGCHNTGGIAPDLSEANAYSDLWLRNMVDTTDAESSVLYVRMSSESSPMPLSGVLKNGEPDYVLNWIKQGAQNN